MQAIKTSIIKAALLFIPISLTVNSNHAFAGSPTVAGNTSNTQTLNISTDDYEAGTLLVKYRQSMSSKFQRKSAIEATIGRSNSVKSIRSLGASSKVKKAKGRKQGRLEKWVHIKLADGVNQKNALKKLRSDPNVVAVEPNYSVSILQTPNDPLFSSLWGLNNTGQTGGTDNADIDAPSVWDSQTGSGQIVVGVIDTGVDYTHEDLAENMWVNPGEVAGNGLDDDGNGYIDDVHGYDFINDDGDPMDDNNHGTHVSGTIAGVGNNGIGVTGVNWNAKIMALKFLGANGSGNVVNAVAAVEYATLMGANLTNNSWGGGGFSQAMLDALNDANDAGIMFVAAAGNASNDNDVNSTFPSSYEVPNVIAVAATNHNDIKAFFSSYGKDSVDLAAPGVSILSTTIGNNYAHFSGTSMATPHVAGATALLMAENPSWSIAEIKALLMSSVDPQDSLSGKTVTAGRLNLNNALNCDDNQQHMLVTTPKESQIAFIDATTLEGLPVIINAYLHTCTTTTTGSTVTVAFDNGETDIVLNDDGLSNDGAANDGVYGASWTPSIIGTTTLSFNAISGSSINTDTRTVEVTPTPTISGTVSSSSGIPVAGIKIQIADNFGFSVTKTTDANGYYRQPVLSGSYVVIALNNTDHVANCGFAFVGVNSEDVIKNCSAKPIISGTVATSNGTPIEGIQIQVADNFGFSTLLTTDANGEYSVAVNDGSYIVMAQSHTLYQTSCGFAFVGVAGLPLTKDCVATPVISGTVTNSVGTPVSGIDIQIANNSGFSTLVSTDTNGHYSQAVTNGTYIVIGQGNSGYSVSCGFAFVGINDVGVVKNCTAVPQ